MRRMMVAVVAAAALIAVAAPAAEARVCARAAGVEILAYGPTSCAFAVEVGAVWGASGGARSIRVYSPVTGKVYRMRCYVRRSYRYTAVVDCYGGEGAHVRFRVY